MSNMENIEYKVLPEERLNVNYIDSMAECIWTTCRSMGLDSGELIDRVVVNGLTLAEVKKVYEILTSNK